MGIKILWESNVSYVKPLRFQFIYRCMLFITYMLNIQFVLKLRTLDHPFGLRIMSHNGVEKVRVLSSSQKQRGQGSLHFLEYMQ